MGEKGNVSTILVVKPEEIGWKPSNMWEDNVKIDVKYTAWWESVYARFTCLKHRDQQHDCEQDHGSRCSVKSVVCP
jgi:hypothetical protein